MIQEILPASKMTYAVVNMNGISKQVWSILDDCCSAFCSPEGLSWWCFKGLAGIHTQSVGGQGERGRRRQLPDHMRTQGMKLKPAKVAQMAMRQSQTTGKIEQQRHVWSIDQL